MIVRAGIFAGQSGGRRVLRIWDGWRIHGGTERTGYRIRPGHEEDPRIVTTSRAGTAPARTACPAGARAARERAAALARIVWDGWQEVARAHPPSRPWADFRPERRPDMPYSDHTALCAAAHEQYLAQTLAAAFRAWAAGLRLDPEAEKLRPVLEELRPVLLDFFFDPLGSIGECTREEFACRGAGWLEGATNLLTLDGWWWEDGGPPLHGVCDDPETCPHAPPGAGRGAPGAYPARLPADTLLVSVRCHVWSGFGPPPRRWLASP